MTLGITTRGLVSPAGASSGGGGGGGGASTLTVPFVLQDSDGNPVAGQTFAGAEVQVSVAGAAFANGLGEVTAIGAGAYYYTYDNAEVASSWSMVKISKGTNRIIFQVTDFAAAQKTDVSTAVTTIGNNITAVGAQISNVAPGVWDVPRSGHATAGTFGEGVNVETLVAAALSAIRDAVLLFQQRTGRTILGTLRRLNTLVDGAWINLNGTTVEARNHLGQLEFSFTQNTTLGTRDASTVTGSES